MEDYKNKVDMIKEVTFNGVVVIDQQGREIAIADEMLVSAFNVVKDSIGKPYQQ